MPFINTRDVIGDQATLDGLVAHTLTELNEDSVNRLASYALYSNSGIVSVAFPSVTSCGISTFYNCINLTDAILPILSYIDINAFMYCKKLENVSAPVAAGCGQAAFMYCSALKKINLPMLINMGANMFQGCPNLSEVSLSTSILSITMSAFIGCTSLTRMHFPNVKTVGSSAFYGCTALSDVSFPAATTIYYSAFLSCPIYKLVLPSAKAIYSQITNYAYEIDLSAQVRLSGTAFYEDENLFSLLLRNNSIATLDHTAALGHTPIEAGYGKIYVQASLVSAYRSATNWVTYAQQIDSIDNYTDGAPVGGITDTWSEILAAEQDGTYSTKYHIGDLKWLKVGGEYCLMQIVAMDADVLANGSGNAKITWLCKGYYGDMQMNSSDTDSGGWALSLGRAYLRESIFPLIDETVRTSIKEVTKTYMKVEYVSGTQAATEESVADTIWLPSAREVGVGSISELTSETSGCVYTELFTDDASRIKYKKCLAFSPFPWWLRSMYNWQQFQTVNSSGLGASSAQSGHYKIVFGFCT